MPEPPPGEYDEDEADRILLELIGLPPDERARVLRERCGGNRALERRVSALLSAHDELGGLGDSLASAPRGPAPGDPPPESIGPYRIVRRLGEGGMGVVYEAEHPSPRRPVALKVIRGSPAGTGLAARFAQEARLLARLGHPGVAQVIESGTAGAKHADGTEETVLFIAMELVPGALPVTRFAGAQGLSQDQRLGLLAEVCEAVHAAHLRGVIHRDLKPGNILVGADGRPKVIDFGVARAIGDAAPDGTLHTMAGQMIGTPAYMSPEQCDGRAAEADARSDVYSLGAVLYELVFGRTLFDFDRLTPLEALAAVRQREPAFSGCPGSRRRRRDLGAVMHKALAKQPEERYGSALALAGDLMRLLSGEPVEARPPGTWRRAARWIGVHPVVSTLAACLLVVGLSLAGTSIGIYVLALRPAALRAGPGPDRVQLLSRGGHILWTWDRGDGPAHMAEMVRLPPELGGGQGVVLTTGLGAPSTMHPGQLGVYRASDPERAVWTTESIPTHAPDGQDNRPEAVNLMGLAALADVFDSTPGPEIVCVSGPAPYSAQAIRVIDLAGRVRYEVWHDGGINAIAWVDPPGLLLVCGLDSEKRWDQRGVAGAADLYPSVVFALEPRDGHIEPLEWIVRDGKVKDGTVLWYRWLGPSDFLPTVPSVSLDYLPPSSGWSKDGRIGIVAGIQGRPGSDLASCFFMLSTAGEVTGLVCDDEYKRRAAAGELPPPGGFTLLDYERLPVR